MSSLLQISGNKNLPFTKIILGVIILCLYSCAQNIYTPALFKNDVSYLPKPMSSDIKKSDTYFSGTYGGSIGSNFNDQINFGEIDISEGHVFNPFNIAYGIYGFTGNIRNNNYSDSLHNLDPNVFQTKSFSGIGARLSGNLFDMVSKRTDFRMIGFEASYSKEFGDYAAYRTAVQNLPGYYSYTSNQLFTLGGTSEIIWKSMSVPELQYSFRLFIGKTFGDFNSVFALADHNTYYSNSDYNNKSVLEALSFNMRFRHIIFSFESNGSVFFLDNLRFKFGYKL